MKLKCEIQLSHANECQNYVSVYEIEHYSMNKSNLFVILIVLFSFHFWLPFLLPKISNGEHRFLIENSKALQFFLFLNHKHLKQPKHLKRILKSSIQLISLSFLLLLLSVFILFHMNSQILESKQRIQLWMSLIFRFIWTVNWTDFFFIVLFVCIGYQKRFITESKSNWTKS